MKSTIETRPASSIAVGLSILAASARVAEEWALRAATECAACARLAGLGEEDAAEALQAAVRSRRAAESADRAGDVGGRMDAMRGAWAAASTAIEAERRVREAIVERMIAGAVGREQGSDSHWTTFSRTW